VNPSLWGKTWLTWAMRKPIGCQDWTGQSVHFDPTAQPSILSSPQSAAQLIAQIGT